MLCYAMLCYTHLYAIYQLFYIYTLYIVGPSERGVARSGGVRGRGEEGPQPGTLWCIGVITIDRCMVYTHIYYVFTRSCT